MNVLVSQNKPCILPAGARTPARNTAVCKAQTRHEIISDVLKGVKQAALIATAAGVLSVVRGQRPTGTMGSPVVYGCMYDTIGDDRR